MGSRDIFLTTELSGVPCTLSCEVRVWLPPPSSLLCLVKGGSQGNQSVNPSIGTSFLSAPFAGVPPQRQETQLKRSRRIREHGHRGPHEGVSSPWACCGEWRDREGSPRPGSTAQCLSGWQDGPGSVSSPTTGWLWRLSTPRL